MSIKKTHKYLILLFIFFVIFFLDRISKLQILNILENDGIVDIYINQFINFYLVWNTGVGFGLFSFDDGNFYTFMTIFILLINIVILIIILRSNLTLAVFWTLVLGGSAGNLYDRIFYRAVPDFIDIHLGDFHWFVFNVSDIFITLGLICLIFAEFLFNKEKMQ